MYKKKSLHIFVVLHLNLEATLNLQLLVGTTINVTIIQYHNTYTQHTQCHNR